MIQGFDPRTGEPVGEPVAETTDAEVDAIVASALAAAPAWGARTALAPRAATSRVMRSPVRTRAKGPPTNDSGATWSTHAP